jgi:pimeloyl-ACP methyl ester carboxylesterase
VRRLLFVALAIVAAGVGVCRWTETPASAQDRTLDLVGTWEGAIQVSGTSLEIRMEFFAEPPEYVWGTIDIPQQGATGLRVRSVHIEGTHVRFELPLGTANAVFDGTYEGDRMSGAFVQGPTIGTFTLERTAAAPPDPEAAVPYVEIPLAVMNGDIVLGGTLTVPDGDGPFPAVVLISGSGPQNRDEEIFGFKVFGVLADHLTRAGIAVLRYDDRGVGASTGSITDATTEDVAGDALSFVAALSARSEIDGARIGLLGHSEGAIAAAIAASRSADPAFVVMLAGTGVRGDQVLRRQAEDGARSLGADDSAVARIATALAGVTCPVLAIFGELDTQVPPGLNRPPVEAALANNPGATIRVYPGANHLFQQASTGLVTEYGSLEKAFVHGLLEDVSEWILEATAR